MILFHSGRAAATEKANSPHIRSHFSHLEEESERKEARNPAGAGKGSFNVTAPPTQTSEQISSSFREPCKCTAVQSPTRPVRGLFVTLPSCGSISRTGTAVAAGARTLWAENISGVHLVILLRGSLAERIPIPVFGGSASPWAANSSEVNASASC